VLAVASDAMLAPPVELELLLELEDELELDELLELLLELEDELELLLELEELLELDDEVELLPPLPVQVVGTSKLPSCVP
jgi:hypothetical protein